MDVVAEVAHEPETELARWSADQFVDMLDTGLLDGKRLELINGLMVKEMPQGPTHDFIFQALNTAFASMNGVQQGLMPTVTIVLGSGSVVEPEFTLLRKEALGRFGLSHEADVLWVVEVSVTSRRKDLTDKRDAYAVAGIPEYWAFDGVRRGVWVFSRPQDGAYAQERFVPAGETLAVPVLGGVVDTGVVFPPA